MNPLLQTSDTPTIDNGSISAKLLVGNCHLSSMSLGWKLTRNLSKL